MTIWLLAVLIIAFYGITGRAVGMVYSFASFFAAIIGAILAPLLSNFFTSVPELVGLPHPIWKVVLPPTMAFLAVVFVVASIGGVVERKVYLHFKYRNRNDETKFFRWERMNRNLGLVLGLFTGLIYLIVVSVGIWIAGYATGQVKSESDHGGLKLLNRLYADAQSTGLGRFAAVFGPAPVEYYEAADLAGLLYNNPNVYERLVTYPNMISLQHRDDIKALTAATNVVELIKGKSGIVAILTHPAVLGLIQNTELRAEYDKLDKADLVRFLSTGKSEKWKDDPLVGYWRFDAKSTEEQFFSKYKKLKPPDRTRLSNYLKVTGSGLTLSFGTDQQAFVEGRLLPLGLGFKDEIRKSVKDGEVVTVTNFVATLPLPAPYLLTPLLASPPGMLVKGTWKKDGDKLSFEVSRPSSGTLTPTPSPSTNAPPVGTMPAPGTTPPAVVRPPIPLPPLKLTSDLEPSGANKLSVKFGNEIFIFERVED